MTQFSSYCFKILATLTNQNTMKSFRCFHRQIVFSTTLLATGIVCSRKTKISNDTSQATSNFPQNKFNSNFPGVYTWGLNTGGVVAPGLSDSTPFVKTPYRIPFFDGKLLRDLSISDSLGVAVLDNGDVVQWGSEYFGNTNQSDSSTPETTIIGKNIIKVEISPGKAVYGLNKNQDTIYYWPVNKNNYQQPKLNNYRWWDVLKFFPNDSSTVHYKTLLTPKLGFREYINDIKVGNDHILVLTSKGRVFSGSSGIFDKHTPLESKGQFGLAKYSQFAKPPPPGVVHEIKSFKNKDIAQIACGEYHSLARTNSGDVYTFGDNSLGQLGIPYTYQTAICAVPTLLPIEKLYERNIKPIATNIAAGGHTSFVEVTPVLDASTFYRQFPGESISSFQNKDILDKTARHIYAFGEGIKGQLGSGTFIHAQSSPLRLKFFTDLKEYSDTMNKLVPLGVKDWTVGKTHVSVAVGGNSNSKFNSDSTPLDALFWGGNDYYQIGTGKKNGIPTPQRIPGLDSPRIKNAKPKETDEKFLTDISDYNDRLQLLQNKKITFTDSTGRKVTAKVSQHVVTGGHCTAVYTSRS